MNDSFQSGYSYTLKYGCGKRVKAKIGGEKDGNTFAPQLSPKVMLRMGVFEGKYLNDCINEFPLDWFVRRNNRGEITDIIPALSPEQANADLNYFGIKSRVSLYEWEKNGWIPVTHSMAARSVLKKHDLKPSDVVDPDPRGWFQWYCRYYIGRRIPVIDEIQMRRWYAFRRHAAQLKANCHPDEENCRRKQRQALLQWAYYDVWSIKDL